MYVAAFDPGPHTGIAVFHNAEVLLTATYWEHDRHRKQLYSDVESVLLSCRTLALEHDEDSICVVERFFTVNPGVSVSPDAILTQRLCGFIEGTALLMGYSTIEWQNSATRKSFEDDAKALPHGTVHEVSALAHGLAYLYKVRTH